MAEVKEKILSGFTPRAVTIGIVLLLIWTFFIILIFPFNVNAAFLWQQYGPQYEWPIQRNYASVILFWVFVPFVVLSFFRSLKKQELLVIYTMLAVGLFAPGVQTSFITLITGPGAGFTMGAPYTDWIPQYMPKTWGPLDYDWYVNTGFYDGGMAVPWGTWAPYIGFWIIFAAVSYAFFAVIGSMIRKIFVDVEDLPFPGEVPTAEFLINSTAPAASEAKKPLWKNGLLWIGFLVGFFGMAGLWLHYVYPPFTTVTRSFVDLTTYAWIPWTALVFSIEPWAIGLGFLLPVSALASSLIWGFIMVAIVSVVATAAGWWPTFPTGNYANTLAWQGFLMPGASPEGFLPWGINPVLWGALVMLGLYPLWRHRSYIMESLRKVSSGEKNEEALSHRTMWIGAVVLGLIILLMMVYQAVPIWLAIIVLLFTIFSELGNTYARGTAWPLWHKFEMMYWVGAFITVFGIWGNVGPTGLAAAVIFMWVFIYHQAISIPTPQTVATLKLAKITKTKVSSVFKSVIIAAIIPFIISVLLNLTLIHRGGILKGYSFLNWGWYGGGGYVQLGLDAGVNHIPAMQVSAPASVIWANVIIGAVLVLVLFVIRAKFPKTSWFTVPASIVISWYLFTTGLVLPWIIALVAKYLTIRIGGEKLYKEKGIPIALGFILGMGLTTFLSALGFYVSHAPAWGGIAPGS